MSHIIGTAAGTVWDYLNKNGESTATMITKQTELDSKLTHRAIGWLAAEGKLTFTQKGRSEVISLKDR